jgi:hypothetical protein
MTRDNMFSPSSNTISFTPIYLQHGDQITVPSISLANNRHQKTSSRTSRSNNASSVRLIRPLPASTISTTTSTTPSQCRQRSNSISSITSSSKRSRLNKDLLTDDEKRVNHIASEQKRRNTIHLGFKNLTDIIPTLKNINNSKSTILFKAVEYIKHLDKRNRGLRETISSLQVRTNVEGRMIQQQQQRRYHHKAIDKCNNSTTLIDYYNPQQPQQHHRLSLPTIESQQKYEFSHLPANAVSALMAHKNQQRQLEELQEQLRVQQQLLAKHNIFPNSSASPPKLASTAASFTQDLFSTTTTTTITTAATETTSNSSNAPTLLQCPETYQYNSISIPSSRSSNSDENENLHHNHQSLIVPQDLQEHQLTSCSNQLTKRPWQSTDNS